MFGENFGKGYNHGIFKNGQMNGNKRKFLCIKLNLGLTLIRLFQ
jgi:hypothetical protein